ncbi:MAG: nucleotidyltransferase domain-containing protein [Bacteroidales bacterium]|nr:nucleotidyltransferase domain-containing protein [Bacteroidales bacterium]
MSALAGVYLSSVGTFWTATFTSGFITGSLVSVGESIYDGERDPATLLWQGLAGGIGGAIFAGLGGIVFRVVAPIWLQYIGRPQGLTQQQYRDFSNAIRSKAGPISDDIAVQGSRAQGIARNISDVDVAIKVSPEEFQQLIQQSFKSPNPGSAAERTMQHAINTGKITAGDSSFKGILRPLRDFVKNMIGLKVDISIIKRGGPFDTGPQIPLN